MGKVTDSLLGLTVGDALGVPAEFMSRSELEDYPIRDMVGYGTHNQPAGTWSDDSSLALCLAESLVQGYQLQDIARKFVAWRDRAYMTAHGAVFDIGISTDNSISDLVTILRTNNLQKLYELKNTGDEYQNGNGSLMRILPLLFYIRGKTNELQFKIIEEVSALTHRHIRAAIACFIYLKFAEHILEGKEKEGAYAAAQNESRSFFSKSDFVPETELLHFYNILENDIRNYDYESISTSGYVVHTLEASLWFFLKFNTYKEITLAAVNAGDDTDTTACVAGGLAGLYYGAESIPAFWLDKLARKDDICLTAKRLEDKYGGYSDKKTK